MSLQPWIARFEGQLEARRQRLSRLLAFKPINKMQEARRGALIQNIRGSVETRARFAEIYRTHLEALQRELSPGSVTNVVPESVPSSAKTRGDLGDY